MQNIEERLKLLINLDYPKEKIIDTLKNDGYSTNEIEETSAFLDKIFINKVYEQLHLELNKSKKPIVKLIISGAISLVLGVFIISKGNSAIGTLVLIFAIIKITIGSIGKYED